MRKILTKNLVLSWMQANPLKDYHFSDSSNFHKSLAIYKVLKDTINVLINDTATYAHFPYIYDFQDFSGQEEWSNMFVTKLFATRKGNCHSLSYLYKILADDLSANCWLVLAGKNVRLAPLPPAQFKHVLWWPSGVNIAGFSSQ